MKNQLNNLAILPKEFGLRKIFLLILVVMQCLPVCGQMSESKIENKRETNPMRTGTGEVISVHSIQLKSDVNRLEFDKWIIDYWNPAMQGLFPGVKSFITIGYDRGDAIGEYAYVLIFDSLKTRDAYLPEEGKHSEWFKEIYMIPNSYLYEELFQFIEGEAFSKYTSWVVLK